MADEREDQVGVVLDAMDRAARAAPRDADVVEESLGLDGVSDLELRPAEERDPGGARAAVEVDEDVVALAADGADEAEEVGRLLLGRNGDDAVEMRVPLDEPAERFLDEVGEGGAEVGALEEGDRGRRQDDVAQAPEAEEEDFARGVSSWSDGRAQSWPRRSA